VLLSGQDLLALSSVLKLRKLDLSNLQRLDRI
jgi:hypothetical protein